MNDGPAGVDTRARPAQAFRAAQTRVFQRYGVEFESNLVRVPSISGRVHVIVVGEGPPVLMVVGGGIVAGTWAPLMAHLTGFTLYAVDLPGQGLTDPAPYASATLRQTGVAFLRDVMDSLELETVPFVGQSIGGLWSTWMALDRPERVSAICYVGCPAVMLGTSAPFPLRLGTIPGLNRLIHRLDPPSIRQMERVGKMAGEDLHRLPELRDLMLAGEHQPDSTASLLALQRAVVRVRGPQPSVEITESQLQQVAKPVQFIWGGKDPFGRPAVGFRAAEIMTEAEIHVVSGGHAPWFDDAERIGTIMSPFLATHASST